MPKSSLTVRFFIPVIALCACVGAQASVVNFSGDPNQFITNYAGFNWTGGEGAISWVNGSVTPLPAAPAVSGGYAWSNGGTNLQFSLAGPGTFDFNSIDLYGDASLWGGSPAVVTIEGWLSGVLVNSFVTPTTLDALPRGAFTTFMLNWSGIDTVKISELPNENVLVANIRYNESAIPEPSSWVLMLGALGSLLLVGRSSRAGRVV